MATFPGGIPSYAGFTGSHTLSADNHAAQHNAEQGDIIALANKVGTGASTPISGTVLRGNGTGTSTWGDADLTTDVTGVLPLANGGTNATSAATARTSLGINTQSETLQAVYPVGAIYIETTGTNPASTFGFGTWIAFGAGRTLIGVGTSDASYAAGATGGESTHALITAELAAHTHTATPAARYLTPDINTGAPSPTGSAVFSYDTSVITTSSTGSGTAHNNLPPYLVVFMWKRTA